MRYLPKSFLVLYVFLPLVALLGCQKGSDSAPPAASVAGGSSAQPASSGKADPQDNATGDASEAAPDPRLQHPTFAIDTTAGKVTVRLDADKAPLTVENFRKYVARGHYEQTIFHQVVKTPVRIVLGGVYTADLKAKAALTPIRNEAHNGLKNRRGTIAMLRGTDDEDSASCQFFFNLSDNNALDFKSRTTEGYGYCVFGEVTEGMDVLDRIANAPLHDVDKFPSLPVEVVAIKSIQQIK